MRLAGSSRAGSFLPAIPGGGGRLWSELMVPWGELGKAGLLPSLYPLVVKGGVRQKGPAGDPAWPTYVFCLEAEIGLAQVKVSQRSRSFGTLGCSMNELTVYWCKDKEVGSNFLSIITGQRHILQVEDNLN